MKKRYTASEALQIKTTFAYFVALSMTLITAISFLVVARMPIKDILPQSLVALFCMGLAFVQYRLKRSRKDSLLIPWVVSFITLAVPFIAKIKYSITLNVNKDVAFFKRHVPYSSEFFYQDLIRLHQDSSIASSFRPISRGVAFWLELLSHSFS